MDSKLSKDWFSRNICGQGALNDKHVVTTFTDKTPAFYSSVKTRGQERLLSFVKLLDEIMNSEDYFYYLNHIYPN